MKHSFIMFAVILAAVLVVGWIAWHFLSARPAVPNTPAAIPAATSTSAADNTATTTATAAVQTSSTTSTVGSALNPFQGLYKNPF